MHHYEALFYSCSMLMTWSVLGVILLLLSLWSSISRVSLRWKILAICVISQALRLVILLRVVNYHNRIIFLTYLNVLLSEIFLLLILHLYLLQWIFTWSFARIMVILYHSPHRTGNLLVLLSIFLLLGQIFLMRYMFWVSLSVPLHQTLCDYSSCTSLTLWSNDIVSTLPFRVSSNSSSLLRWMLDRWSDTHRSTIGFCSYLVFSLIS